MWYECPLAVTTIPNMRPECIQQSVHSCPGIFGFWPIIDRSRDYWFQVVDYGEAVTNFLFFDKKTYVVESFFQKYFGFAKYKLTRKVTN